MWGRGSVRGSVVKERPGRVNKRFEEFIISLPSPTCQKHSNTALKSKKRPTRLTFIIIRSNLFRHRFHKRFRFRRLKKQRRISKSVRGKVRRGKVSFSGDWVFLYDWSLGWPWNVNPQSPTHNPQPTQNPTQPPNPQTHSHKPYKYPPASSRTQLKTLRVLLKVEVSPIGSFGRLCVFEGVCAFVRLVVWSFVCVVVHLFGRWCVRAFVWACVCKCVRWCVCFRSSVSPKVPWDW